MAKFEVIYTAVGRKYEDALDTEIEADFFKAEGKFFTFYVDKEVTRTIQLDLVVQIKRVDQ